MVKCLTSASMSMVAEIIRGATLTPSTDPLEPDNGSWDVNQDPITGEILNEWTPNSTQGVTDPTDVVETVSCLARGVISQGVYASGSYENYGKNYINGEVVQMWLPANVRISKRDRVTNIRNKKGGNVVFLDEDYGDRPTVFNVNGITPTFDGFNRHISNFVLLEKVSH